MQCLAIELAIKQVFIFRLDDQRRNAELVPVGGWVVLLYGNQVWVASQARGPGFGTRLGNRAFLIPIVGAN